MALTPINTYSPIPPIAANNSPSQNDPHFLTPPLTGQYSVGVRSCYADDNKQLLVDVHYPANPSKYAPYKVLPLSPDKHPMNIDSVKDPAKKAKLANLCTRSQPGLEPVNKQFPVVIFSHGKGADHCDYQNLVEELASHGYCVITVSHPASNGVSAIAQISPPDPPPGLDLIMPALRKQAMDVIYLISQIQAGRFGENIDVSKIGVMGHSLGGDTALEACRLTPLIQTGIDLDSGCLRYVEQVKILQPFLSIFGGEGFGKIITEADGTDWDVKKDWEQFAAISPAQKHVVPNATHNDFGVQTLFLEIKDDTSNPHITQINRETHEAIVNWFNRHLKAQSAPLLDSSKKV